VALGDRKGGMGRKKNLNTDSRAKAWGRRCTYHSMG